MIEMLNIFLFCVLVLFTITLFIERYFNDHDKLTEKKGDAVPDFVNKNGITYELKSGKNLEYAPLIRNWYGADRKLFYCTSDNNLYLYDSDTNSFKMIKRGLRAPYINIKRFDNLEAQIMKKI